MKILYVCKGEFNHMGINFNPIKMYFTKAQHDEYCSCKPDKISVELIKEATDKTKKEKEEVNIIETLAMNGIEIVKAKGMYTVLDDLTPIDSFETLNEAMRFALEQVIEDETYDG